MKFIIENGIAIVREHQISAGECYTNSLRKAKSMDVNAILMDIDINNDLEQG